MASEPRNFALIIGAAKSGTTSLFRYLAEHPEIAPCSEKDPEFFSKDENWAKGMDWYRGLWKWRPAQHTIALEGSVHYTNLPREPHTTERIAQVDDASFRFIYIMRHPLQRIESHSRAKTFVEGLSPLDQGVPPHAIWVSQYAMQLEAYKRFGRDRLLLLFTEDLKRDAKSVVQTVCRFLEIDPDYEFKALDYVHNTRQRFSRRRPKLLRRLRRVGLVDAVVQRLPHRTVDWLHTRLGRRVEVDQSRFRLSAEQREFVLRELRPDLQRLQSEYGVDVESRWGIRLAETSDL